ncbi:MAG: anaerobic carbon-monoxide dehydrogenase catalytic subunit [Chloroflexi bacterium]|jgi:carbon-monoxide dehydrogenase catalytic subunit|nr:anaerobic carbon-monoxide dehydrogenase catalytic subunit [Chloroflexota bacterium]
MSDKSVDCAANEMLERCDGVIETAFDRAAQIKPCPVGADSSCCKMCFMGPCRLVGKTTRGVCGATRATVAARNYARAVAGGSAAHSDHGRGLAFALLAVARGEAQGFRIRDTQKLYAVASYLNIATEGRSVNAIAEDVATKALDNFGQQTGLISYASRATPKRQQIWQDLGLTPRSVDREIVEIMHRTHMGVDQDAENILKQAMRTALGDGWAGSMLATDISDILFGTPSPLQSAVNLGVLKDDEVNIVLHGHDPALSEMIVAASTDPELLAYAESKGAKGINLAGICCTANEVLMRHGIPPAGNFLSQELAIATGAVEAMIVDVQCIMQALAEVAKAHHTRLITTSSKAMIEGATHIEFDEQHAYDCAKNLVRAAIDNYPNRGQTHIPPAREELVAGFSHEYIGYMQGGLYRGSFRPLNDAVIAGRIRGLAAVVGCNNARVTQDSAITKIVRELIANDVLVVVTGCAATGAAKEGYLRPEFMDKAGPGLREVCEAIGVPPVLHVGSCVDNSRILTILTQCATEGGLGEDISDIPAVGICPEYMSEKALAIGTYCAASGAHVLFGIHNPVAGSPEVTELISKGWEATVGGSMEFEPDVDRLIARAFEIIDAKREALGLAEYNPNRFGQSGDALMEEALRATQNKPTLGFYSISDVSAE